MRQTCFVTGCNSGHSNNPVKVPMFKAPANEKQLKIWLRVSKKKSFPKQKGPIYFCANHFEESDIIKTSKRTIPAAWEEEPDALERVRKKMRHDKLKLTHFRNIVVPLKVWRLKEGALPKTDKG